MNDFAVHHDVVFLPLEGYVRPEGLLEQVGPVDIGAGIERAYAGDVLTMPGLPKKPAAESIDIDESGQVVGLF